METITRKFNVAIDGPAGAGKSTVARMVAKELGFIYIDTGAMYRAITYKVLQEGLDIARPYEIIEMAKKLQIKLIPQSWGQQVLIDGSDVTERLRSPEVNRLVSAISQIKEVRQLLTDIQQQMASAKGVVMDGRDIGTSVLPDAEVKVFLSADVKERARRRWEEIKDSQPNMTLEQLEEDIARRDLADQQREVSPLVRAHDAVFIDSTNMSISEVTEHILQLCRTIMSEAK